MHPSTLDRLVNEIAWYTNKHYDRSNRGNGSPTSEGQYASCKSMGILQILSICQCAFGVKSGLQVWGVRDQEVCPRGHHIRLRLRLWKRYVLRCVRVMRLRKHVILKTEAIATRDWTHCKICVSTFELMSSANDWLCMQQSCWGKPSIQSLTFSERWWRGSTCISSAQQPRYDPFDGCVQTKDAARLITGLNE